MINITTSTTAAELSKENPSGFVVFQREESSQYEEFGCAALEALEFWYQGGYDGQHEHCSGYKDLRSLQKKHGLSSSPADEGDCPDYEHSLIMAVKNCMRYGFAKWEISSAADFREMQAEADE